MIGISLTNSLSRDLVSMAVHSIAFSSMNVEKARKEFQSHFTFVKLTLTQLLLIGSK